MFSRFGINFGSICLIICENQLCWKAPRDAGPFCCLKKSVKFRHNLVDCQSSFSTNRHEIFKMLAMFLKSYSFYSEHVLKA